MAVLLAYINRKGKIAFLSDDSHGKKNKGVRDLGVETAQIELIIYITRYQQGY
jgi:hypothetical protein